MLGKLSFSKKILLLPGLSALSFLLVLLLNQTTGARNDRLMQNIQAGYAPALEISRDLEADLALIQRGLQDAVAASELEKLNETDAVRDRLLGRFRQGQSNPAFDAGELKTMEEAFGRYYVLARNTSARMIRGETGASFESALQRMTADYNTVKTAIESSTAARRPASPVPLG